MRTNKIIEAIHEGRLDERLTEIYADPYIIPYEKKRYEQALYQYNSVHRAEARSEETIRIISTGKCWQHPLTEMPLP